MRHNKGRQEMAHANVTDPQEPISQTMSQPIYPPTLSTRQRAILSQIEDKGFVTLEALAEAFNVSMQTVRRDVIGMHESGLIERFHGGAGVRDGRMAERLDHAQKRMLGQEGKEVIAMRATALVRNGQSVFLDVGTTMEATANALNTLAGLAIFTNSMHVASLFDPVRHEVRLLPGRVTGPDGSLTGEDTVLALAALRLDHAFVGCSAIERDEAAQPARAMDFDSGKIAIKQTAMRVAQQSTLLALSDKYGRSARQAIAPLARFDDVINELPLGTD